MVEYFFTTHKSKLHDVLEAFFAGKDKSIIQSCIPDGNMVSLSALGTWETYRRLMHLPDGMVSSLEHFEDEKLEDPFQSPEWIEFLTAEAGSRGISLMQMIVCLGKMNPTDFEIFEKAYLNKFYQKYGRIL